MNRHKTDEESRQTIDLMSGMIDRATRCATPPEQKTGSASGKDERKRHAVKTIERAMTAAEGRKKGK